MMKSNVKRSLIAIGATISLGAIAHAASIEGGIGINLSPTGSLTYDGTSLDFSGGAGNSEVVVATGDYTPLIGQAATYFDFSFDPLMDNNPGDGNPEPLPDGAYIWEIVSDPGIHFILTSVIGSVDGLGVLSLSGSGLAYMNAQGKDITPGKWKLSADNTGAVFNFSSTTSAPASVPDSSATFGLLGMGLLVLGAVGRRIRNK